MFVIVFDPTTGKRLGSAGLLRQTGALRALFRIGSRLGIVGLRSEGRPYAVTTRDLFVRVMEWVAITGYSVKVETTSAEAQALLRGGLVPSAVGTYRLQTNVAGVQVLAGHGKA